MSVRLRTHIVPVGFQIRRITQPLKDMQADRVYFVRVEANDNASSYYDEIIKDLKSNYPHIEVKQEFVDIWDLYECITKFREIIQGEAKNEVFINVSSGTKITAIAGMLSCMLWNAQPYYARVSYPDQRKLKKQPTEHVEPDPEILPVYDIIKPKNEYMVVISHLQENDGKMRKSNLIKKLEEDEIIRPMDVAMEDFKGPAKHSQLRSILEPMENDWDYIKIVGSGKRSEVILTMQGKNALRIFGCQRS